jgi:hypothetical protein
VSATAAMRTRLREYINEPRPDTYTDDELDTIIERYPVIDERGEVPYTWDTSTTPPTQDDNDDWVATYDLHAAAADIWDAKALGHIENYDYTADGATLNRSQVYQNMRRQANYHRSRRKPFTIEQRESPDPDNIIESYVVNRFTEND